MAPTQHAYRKNRSTGDIVLVQTYFVANAMSRLICKFCIGNDMSNAVDALLRLKLIGFLRKLGVDERTVRLIEIFLDNSNLAIKWILEISQKFRNSIEVPQGYGLSTKLFTIYLNEVFNENGTKIKSPYLEDHR